MTQRREAFEAAEAQVKAKRDEVKRADKVHVTLMPTILPSCAGLVLAVCTAGTGGLY